MSIIHLNHIAARLDEMFGGKIDSSDCVIQRDKNSAHFYTRALAAFAVVYTGSATIEDAVLSITDGHDDEGVDAIYYSETDHKLVLVQSKWNSDGCGEPSNADVRKFVSGCTKLINCKFENLNAKIKAKREVITRALRNAGARYEIVLVYSGSSTLSAPSKNDLEELRNELNDVTGVVGLRVINQAGLYGFLTASVDGHPIDIELAVKHWGLIDSPHRAFYGQVDGFQIASLFAQHGERLFSKNIRGILGSTEVNNEIRDTLSTNPDLFWFYNNGITLIATKFEKAMIGGASKDLGIFKCYGASVVNGAQTVSSIGRFGLDQLPGLDKVTVQVRIISTELNGENLANAVTRANNKQNRIESRDFVSQDPDQQRLRKELAVAGYSYEIVRRESPIIIDSSIDLIEATIALACASRMPSIFVQLKREIGRFWDDLSGGIYRKIFPSNLSSHYLLRCVLVQRLIDQCSEKAEQSAKENGQDFGFLIHGNRMISALCFNCLNVSSLHDPRFDFESFIESDLIAKAFQKVVCELLIELKQDEFAKSNYAGLFKNHSKCELIFSNCTRARKIVQAELF